ncbi:MAG: hypothetical protein AAF291_08280 [Pseudomonadota bacterium]
MTLRTCFTTILPALCAASMASAGMAQDQDGAITVDLEVFGGRSVVPPDIIENDIDQERLEGVIGGDFVVTYREGDTRIFVGAGAEAFPTDNLLNRYAFGLGGSQDIPIAQGGRIRLRLGGAYDHVRGDQGRVFDRARADAQMIARHGGGHSSLGRIRYGYRDQSEERFTGFDQSEWLGELRHTYRIPGTQTSISGALLALDVDAEDDRFSFQGLGFRVIGRVPLGNEWLGFGRVSYFNRDYEDPFNAAFPIARQDDVWRISGGLERPLTDTLSGFAELGYIDHGSNIPVRDFSGLLGRVGVRMRLR